MTSKQERMEKEFSIISKLAWPLYIISIIASFGITFLQVEVESANTWQFFWQLAIQHKLLIVLSMLPMVLIGMGLVRMYFLIHSYRLQNIQQQIQESKNTLESGKPDDA